VSSHSFSLFAPATPTSAHFHDECQLVIFSTDLDPLQIQRFRARHELINAFDRGDSSFVASLACQPHIIRLVNAKGVGKAADRLVRQSLQLLARCQSLLAFGAFGCGAQVAVRQGMRANFNATTGNQVSNLFITELGLARQLARIVMRFLVG